MKNKEKEKIVELLDVEFLIHEEFIKGEYIDSLDYYSIKLELE